MIRALLLWTLIVLCITLAFAASVGPNGPTTSASGGGVGEPWTSPSNAEASDVTYATQSLDVAAGLTASEHLKLTNFGFSIPAGATINGVVATVYLYSVSSNGSTEYARLYKGGVLHGSSPGYDLTATNSLSGHTVGGASDLWGGTYTETDIEATGFGIGIDYIIPITGGSETGTCGVDYAELTVYYTEASGGSRKRIIGAAHNITRSFLDPKWRK